LYELILNLSPSILHPFIVRDACVRLYTPEAQSRHNTSIEQFTIELYKSLLTFFYYDLSDYNVETSIKLEGLLKLRLNKLLVVLR